jgi:outer membrane protein insertion porin family
MQRHINKLLAVLILVAVSQSSFAQQPTSVDPALLELQNAKVSKEYTIASIIITGVTTLDTAIVRSISGLQVGDQVMIPGGDAFSKAISNLWRQRLFSNVQIFITGVKDDAIDIEIAVEEMPKLGSVRFRGIKKSEQEELNNKINLAKQTIITENRKRTAVDIIKRFYIDKGFMNVRVDVAETPDPTFANSNALVFTIDKGNKVRVNEVNFYGNTDVSDLKLKKQMKGTKEMTKITLHPTDTSSAFGVNEKMTFREYVKDLGFLSPSKTRNFLDPYFRFKLFSSAKFDQKKLEEDKEKILDYYNALGYRDAQIVDTKIYPDKEGNLQVDILVNEGNQYYFGDITWKGNTKYSDSLLMAFLGIRKGDTYDLDKLNKRLGKQLSMEGGDISGLYMDDGYLFFRVDPVETSVYNDTIDFEIRVVEGPQATIGTVGISGNEKTKDYVIRRELRTLPGEKFSRTDLIRSQRELAALGYFNQEKINPDIVPDQEKGTVDINWQLEEKSSDQLELSAGWGGGIGLTGTLGVSFNNFSIKNILKREAWDPLPQGDGQKLSLRYQSSGRQFNSMNFSFTEPWLGGKKRNSLTFSLFRSRFSNVIDPVTGIYERRFSDSNYLKTFGASISLGKQLKWPDDFFTLVYSLNFTQYKIKNYFAFRKEDGTFLDNGNSTNFSLKLALQRSSINNPQFPTGGSNFMASVQLTPPYSLLNPDLVTSSNPYKNPEYHKWRFNAEWFVPLTRPMGAEKNRQLVLRMAAKYGFMGRYNRKLGFSPFERFQVGGDGLTNNFGLLGYDIIALRGYPVFETSDPSVNPDINNANQFFTIFNKYQLELRYPLVTNASSNIYGLAFFDAANGWYSFKDYNPFRLRRSVGVGMRFFLPMFGLLGFDYGIGLDRLRPGEKGLKNAARFTFMLGFEPE